MYMYVGSVRVLPGYYVGRAQSSLVFCTVPIRRNVYSKRISREVQTFCTRFTCGVHAGCTRLTLCVHIACRGKMFWSLCTLVLHAEGTRFGSCAHVFRIRSGVNVVCRPEAYDTFMGVPIHMRLIILSTFLT